MSLWRAVTFNKYLKRGLWESQSPPKKTQFPSPADIMMICYKEKKKHLALFTCSPQTQLLRGIHYKNLSVCMWQKHATVARKVSVLALPGFLAAVIHISLLVFFFPSCFQLDSTKGVNSEHCMESRGSLVSAEFLSSWQLQRIENEAEELLHTLTISLI